MSQSSQNSSPASPGLHRTRIVLGLLLLVAVAYLLLGDDPMGRSFAARELGGKRLRPLDYAAAYGWWMTLVNACVLVLVVWRFQWIERIAAHVGLAEFAAPAAASPSALRFTVALAMLALAFLAAPRLDDALWTDEKYMVMRSIAGFYEPAFKDGPLRFDEVSWRETFFYYRKPNNHVPYSISARLSWAIWKATTQPKDQRAAEQAVRLPALLAGMGGVGTLAWCLWRLGFTGAAGFAAWLLALHPWYLRYSSEARGYTLMLALLPVALITAFRVLERGSWGRWAAYSAVQVLLLWTYPGAIFVPVLLNLWLAFQLLARGHPAGASSGARLPALGRFLVANVASALVWLQLNLPNMMQFLAYSKEWRREITAAFLHETGSLLLLGLHDVPPSEAYISLATTTAEFPILLPTIAGVAGLAIAWGIITTPRAGAAARGALVILLPPALCTLAFAALRGDHLYSWYIIHLLPGVVAMIAVGLARAFPRGPLRRWVMPVACVAFLLGFTWITQPMRQLLRSRDVQPVITMLREFGWPPDSDPVAPRPFLTGAVYGPPIYYDPATIFTRNEDDLRDLIQKADRTEQVLYVSFNRKALARRRNGRALAMLENPDLFEPMGMFEGVYPKYRRYVFRYLPGSLETFDAVSPESEPVPTDTPQ